MTFLCMTVLPLTAADMWGGRGWRIKTMIPLSENYQRCPRSSERIKHIVDWYCISDCSHFVGLNEHCQSKTDSD